MPQFRKKQSPPLPADPDDWRPQRFGRGGRMRRDAIVEPSWSGVRVMVRFDARGTRLVDDEGVDCTVEFGEVAQAIAAAAQADQLILDGFLTVEATQQTAGVPPPDLRAPGMGRMMAQMVAGNRIVPPATPTRRLDPDRPVAFVAVDLLEIDGTPLLDVPLLERKRLLDGSLVPTDLVRITPFVQQPIGSFLNTWRDLGFYALAYKGANSRYVPDAVSDDWSIVRIPSR